jgi:hypothetical protein
MKAALVASVWAMRALTDLRVPLRDDLPHGSTVPLTQAALSTSHLALRDSFGSSWPEVEPALTDKTPHKINNWIHNSPITGLKTHLQSHSSPRWPGANTPAATVIVWVMVVTAVQMAD